MQQTQPTRLEPSNKSGFGADRLRLNAAALSGRFDCFIFDVSMPGMTGIDLLRRVRDRGVRTPAMFLTAHDSIEDKVAGFQAGAGQALQPARA